MTQKFMKIYPTTDDIGKTPIVVADETKVNGVGIEFSEALNISELADDTFLYKTTVANVPVLISKSMSELKGLLNLPNKIYECYVNASGTSNPTITTIKNSLESNVAWTRDDVGYFVCAVTVEGIPSGEFTSGKTICITQMRGTATPFIIGLSLGTNSINFQTFNISGNPTDSLDFYVRIEVYE